MNRFFRSYWLGLICILGVQTGCSAKKSVLHSPEPPPHTLADFEANLSLQEYQLRNLGVAVESSSTQIPRLEESPEASSASKQEVLSEDESEREKITDRSSNVETKKANRGVMDPSSSQMYQGQGISRCKQICQIAISLCDLETKICQLADKYSNEPHYQQVCDRAHNDCQIATEECHACHE